MPSRCRGRGRRCRRRGVPRWRRRAAAGCGRAAGPGWRRRPRAGPAGRRRRSGRPGSVSDGGRVAVGQLQGRPEQDRDGDGAGAEGPHDAVEPHARVEARHPGADERDQRDVQRQVVPEVEEVGDRRERLLVHRGDRQRVDEVARDAEQARERERRPGDAIGARTPDGGEARESGTGVDGVVENQVVDDRPGLAGRAGTDTRGEHGQGEDGEADATREKAMSRISGDFGCTPMNIGRTLIGLDPSWNESTQSGEERVRPTTVAATGRAARGTGAAR